MESLLSKLPPKEQLFFAFAVLFALYLVIQAPRGARTFEAVQRAVIMNPENHGDFNEQRLMQILDEAQKGIPQTTPVGGDRLKQMLDRRLASPVVPEKLGRPAPFRPSSEIYQPMPPVRLPDVVIAGTPGFDPPSGLAPSINFQIRPRALPDGRVRLVRQDNALELD